MKVYSGIEIVNIYFGDRLSRTCLHIKVEQIIFTLLL